MHNIASFFCTRVNIHAARLREHIFAGTTHTLSGKRSRAEMKNTFATALNTRLVSRAYVHRSSMMRIQGSFDTAV